MEEKTVCKFNINNICGECFKEFDLDEAPARKAKNIKVLFRGVSKVNPHKVIVFVQAEEEVVRKHIQENIANFKKNGSELSTAIPSTWLK